MPNGLPIPGLPAAPAGPGDVPLGMMAEMAGAAPDSSQKADDLVFTAVGQLLQAARMDQDLAFVLEPIVAKLVRTLTRQVRMPEVPIGPPVGAIPGPGPEDSLI